MRCPKCSTENSERRRFCRECGSLIVIFCRRCGFHNSPADKYCGGCGISLIGAGKLSNSIDTIPSHPSIKASGKYSADDIKELIEQKDKTPKKRVIRETDAVSQDMLDSMFDSETDDKQKEK